MSTTVNTEADSEPVTKSESLWAISGYKTWFVGDTSLVISGTIQVFVFPLLLLATGAKPDQVAFVSAAAMLVTMVLIIPGGVGLDRFNRYKLAVVDAVVRGLLLAAAVALLCFGWFNIWTVLVLDCCLAALTAFAGNAGDFLLRELVPAKQFHRAVQNNSVRDSTLSIVMKPIAGFLLELSHIFTLGVALFLSLVASVAFKLFQKNDPARHKLDESQKTDKEKITLSYVLDGFKGIVTNPFLRSLTFVEENIVRAAMSVIFIVVLDAGYNGVQAGTIGFLSTATAIGTLCGSLLIGWVLKRFRGGTIAICNMFLSIICVALLLVADGMIWKIIVVIPLYLLLPSYSASANSLIMLAINQKKFGRLLASKGIVQMIVEAGFRAMTGTLLLALGFRGAVTVFLVIMVVLTLIMMFMPVVRNRPLACDNEEFAKQIAWN